MDEVTGPIIAISLVLMCVFIPCAFITGITGQFEAGDPVSCLDPDGKEFAKGLVNFSSEVLKRVRGLKTQDIQQQLGPQEYEEVIHRDNLVVL